MSVIVHTEDGLPVMFADVPNSGVRRVNTQQKSGNTNYDARSGKFTSGAKNNDEKPLPPNTDPNEYARMYAAVREAARKLGDFDEEKLRAFLEDRAQAPDQVDFDAFLNMVKQQRVNDLIDIIADRLGDEAGAITLQASDEDVDASLQALGDAERQQIENVLVSRGIEQEKITKYFDQRPSTAVG